jgi:8-oxo-dGTP pyrophosphatase MutT (NUDIX family)
MDEIQHDQPREQQRADAPGGHPDTPDSPWRTLDARETYVNRWLTVTEYTVLRPDRTHGIYGVVDPGDNVTIAALDAEERIQILGEFRYPLQRWQWLLPGGMVEHGEDPLPAAQRELMEETGVWADDWLSLGSYPLTSGISSQVSHLFLARGLHQGEANPEGTELHLRARLMTLQDAYAACLSGEISEATSVLAIWRAWFALHASS